ncbi:alpha/beta hydrolase [Ramlibacter sp. G-1-2-2]|uniref:Alpha/beta hydrolase n=1 Tax=Ramlibacter agri TaxID=2728837 RepID=A0A848HB02_9BURK|nr:alpha/beta fold hydrolase [Ramlibacter agri]NML46591.1 alpha/beta hydrolase [Ramlibacter agri]
MAEQEVSLPMHWGRLCGSLLLPERAGPWPAALLVAGSGPTDRDGNNFLLDAPCDNLKLLAQALAARGIASLRYDKRGVGASSYPGLSEDALRFEQLVDDATALGRHLQQDDRFLDLTLLGHSEGALIASLAALELGPRALVCVAGAGERASDLIRRQLEPRLPPDLLAPALAALDALDAEETVDDVPDALTLLLRPSVQPYLISWFRHDPPQVLAQLDLPVLLLQGDADRQVDMQQARQLHVGRPDAALKVLRGLDHLLALDGSIAGGTDRVAAEVAQWLEALEKEAA